MGKPHVQPYVVIDKQTGKILRLIDAKSMRDAVNHHLGRSVEMRLATHQDMFQAGLSSVSIEVAGEDPPPDVPTLTQQLAGGMPLFGEGRLSSPEIPAFLRNGGNQG